MSDTIDSTIVTDPFHNCGEMAKKSCLLDIQKVRDNDPNYKVLDWNNRNVGADGAKEIAEALTKNSSVTTIDLTRNEIGADGAKAIAEALKKNSSVTEIYLNNNGIGYDGGMAIAKALAENSSVTSIDLSNNKIGADGAKLIAEALKKNSSVTHINLSGNEIGDGGEQNGSALDEDGLISAGFGDSANKGSDRLGYELYAEALAKHAISVEDQGGNETLCVGLFAPWGAGKSFIWNLIQKELVKSDEKRFKDKLKADDSEDFEWNLRESIGIQAVFQVLLFFYSEQSKDPDIEEFIKQDIVELLPKQPMDKNNENHSWKLWKLLREVVLAVICLPLWITSCQHLIFERYQKNGEKVSCLYWLLGYIVLSPWWILSVFVYLPIIWFQRVYYYLRVGEEDDKDKYYFLFKRPIVKSVTHRPNKEKDFARKFVTELHLVRAIRGPCDRGCAESAGLYLLCNFIFTTLGAFSRALFCSFASRKPFKREVEKKRIFVEFDAWTYKGADTLWASLLESLWNEVEREFGNDEVKWHRAGVELADLTGISEDDTVAIEQARKKATYNLKMKWNVSVSFLVVSSMLFLAAIVFLIIAEVNKGETTNDAEKNKKFQTINAFYVATGVVATALVVFITTLRQFLELVRPGIDRITDGLKPHNRADFSREAGFMKIVQTEINYLFAFVASHKRRLVVFVDDLDRCEQKITMEVLWAVSLLLSDGPISIWLAVDSKILIDHIEADSDTNVNGFRYLEKIVHLPFSIPDIDSKGKLSYCKRVVDTLELTVSQVYEKLYSLRIKPNSPIFVSYMSQEHVHNNDEQLKELYGVAELMKSDSFDYSHLIDLRSKKLFLAGIPEGSSKREDFCAGLLNNIRVFEEYMLPRSVYKRFYEQYKELSLQNIDPPLANPMVPSARLMIEEENDLVGELLRVVSDADFADFRRAISEPIISLVLIGAEKDKVLKYVSEVARLLKNPRFISEKLMEKFKNLPGFPSFPTSDTATITSMNNMATFFGIDFDHDVPMSTNETFYIFLRDICPRMEENVPRLISERVFIFLRDELHVQFQSITFLDPQHLNNEERINQLKTLAKFVDDDYDWDMDDMDMTNFLTNFLLKVYPKLEAMKNNSLQIEPNNGADSVASIVSGIDVTCDSEYKSKSTFDRDERDFLQKYSQFFDGRPRKLKRILNCYNTTKYIALRSGSQIKNRIFKEKLFVFTVLQEMWPYHTVWLLKMAQHAEEGIHLNRSSTQKNLHIMLEKLKSGKFRDIRLSDVYIRIVQGVMHSLPNSRKRMETDANTENLSIMLECLVLGDLYPDYLQPFAFNLPRSLVDEVSKYESEGVISIRENATNDDIWCAVYTKASSYYESTIPIPL